MDFTANLQSIGYRLDGEERALFEQRITLLLKNNIHSEAEMMNVVANQSLSEELRITVCKILLYFDQNLAIRILRDVIAPNYGDVDVRKTACEVMGFFRDSGTVDMFGRLLSEDENSEIRRIAAYWLGKIGDKSAIDILMQRLDVPTEAIAVRGEVFESLAYLNAEQTVPYLVKALQDDHAEVRFWAAFALGHLGDSTVIKDLERISSDETLVAGWGTVGREALEAINHISNRMQLKG